MPPTFESTSAATPADPNPARRSAGLEALFPAGAVAAELTGAAPLDALTVQEHAFISHCARKRIADFAAGRACAHRILQSLGFAEFSLLNGESREPLWPTGIVGSITHTKGYSAAVAARAGDLRGVGIDCELIDAVNEEIWRAICVPPELARLAGLAPEERGAHAALIFAAKEAFYKFQFPLSGQWVGFEDVMIELAGAEAFRIIPQKPLPIGPELVSALTARFRYFGRWVLAAVAAA